MKKLFILLFFSINAIAQLAGDLDTSFGVAGKVLTNMDMGGISDSVIYEQAMQTDGKIILVGIKSTSSGFIYRFNTDGTFDTGFNQTGKFYTNYKLLHIEIQSDGKIVCAGDTKIIRVTTDGVLDTSFNSNGVIDQSSVDLTIQSDDKIIITNGGGAYAPVLVRRYTVDGILDTSFGSNGILTAYTWSQAQKVSSIQFRADNKIVLSSTNAAGHGLSNGSIRIFDTNNSTLYSQINVPNTGGSSGYTEINSFFMVQPDNKILVPVSTSATPQSRIYRYNSVSALDTSFGTNGSIAPNVVFNSNKTIIKSQPDGKFVLYNSVANSFFRYNYDGSIDTSFGNNGQVNMSGFNLLNPKVSDFSIQNNNIYISGYTTNNTTLANPKFLAKINPDGNVDNSFGNTGSVIFNDSDAGTIDTYIKSALLPDGKIIISGNTNPASNSNIISIAKYNPDGSLDNSFGNSGKQLYNFFNNTNTSLRDISIQNDGKITLILDGSNIGGKSLVNLNSDGTINTSFGNNGFYQINYKLNHITVQNDNKIIVCGTSGNSTQNCLLSRFNPNGTIDTTFGNNSVTGYTNTDINKYLVSKIKVLDDGKILVCGAVIKSSNGDSDEFFLKFNSNGSIDTTFGTNGFACIINTSNKKGVTSFDIQSDGKIVFTSVAHDDYYTPLIQGKPFFIKRLTSSGILDTSFGTNGEVNLFIEDSNVSNDIKILNNDKIIVVGSSKTATSTYSFAIAKFDIDGNIDTSFGTLGKVTTPFNPGVINGYSALLANDNRLLVFGNAENGLLKNDFAIAKYYLDDGLRIPENGINSTLFFYPNPAFEKIHFNIKIKLVSIYSLEGKLINSKMENDELNVSHLSKGIYLITALGDNDKIFAAKLIKN